MLSEPGTVVVSVVVTGEEGAGGGVNVDGVGLVVNGKAVVVVSIGEEHPDITAIAISSGPNATTTFFGQLSTQTPPI
jgi:hypothetical protein